jgi:hypothetical protein
MDRFRFDAQFAIWKFEWWAMPTLPIQALLGQAVSAT